MQSVLGICWQIWGKSKLLKFSQAWFVGPIILHDTWSCFSLNQPWTLLTVGAIGSAVNPLVTNPSREISWFFHVSCSSVLLEAPTLDAWAALMTSTWWSGFFFWWDEKVSVVRWRWCRWCIFSSSISVVFFYVTGSEFPRSRFLNFTMHLRFFFSIWLHR